MSLHSRYAKKRPKKGQFFHRGLLPNGSPKVHFGPSASWQERVAGDLIRICIDMHGARAVQKLVDTVRSTPVLVRFSIHIGRSLDSKRSWASVKRIMEQHICSS